MKRTLTGDFLPLGSVIRLQETENDDLLYFIIARAVAKNSEDAVISRYRVAPHPFGAAGDQEILTIQVDQIAEIVFKGYEDEQDKDFLDSLFKRMENAGSRTTAGPQTKKAEEASQVQPVNEEELLKQDPFYKFKMK